ncbi:MAG: UDP-N-acetylglucosamine--N-acetylmuramyl-(pentapeptide) pyrophosphoryl-undecaprenol N-acetylglucosamine transferase [Candidatus Pacebacteria bacterium]|nr:UDP-N-acetylglucosamine--N-acetylmuramyl-(pentapeptide) pyrophosphoryl-undecaprenol N-acetylglucosamine transferase [Candidatus Paceibacterota bacterium]
MKIIFTGGGTGGHFYPIIAVAQKLNALLLRENLLDVKLFYMSTEPYNQELLEMNNITFKKVTAGKLRVYFSFLNFIDPFKTVWGTIKVLFQMFILFPDVVFSKGGFASMPALIAARFFRIPVIIHESDSAPGRANAWAGKFAEKIAISYPEAAQYFPEGRTALTGNPIREDLITPSGKDAFKELGLDPNIPVLLVLGGSLGAQKINEQIVTLAPRLVEKYQVIHQTGLQNQAEVELLIDGLLNRGVSGSANDNPNAGRYHIHGYLDGEKMRMASEVATVVISRAGSAIFEIAAWNIPAILIPIAETNGDHQRKNAFSYMRAGGAIVIEEANLAPNLLFTEIDGLILDEPRRLAMKESAKAFAKTDAAEKIAEQIVEVLIKHLPQKTYEQ